MSTLNNPAILRRRQLDRSLSSISPENVPAFKRGYIRELRDALGLSSSSLGRKLSVTQPAITQLEKSESEGSISLNTLRKVAEAMNCSLVYALVPKTSLESILDDRARKVATELIASVDHSMALESQSTSVEEQEKQIAELADELKRNLDKRLWD